MQLGSFPQVTEPSGVEHLSPALVRVVNDKPGDAEPRPGIRERHSLPFVPEIFVGFSSSAKEAVIRPPRGLLQLGRQQLLLDIISPRILVTICFLHNKLCKPCQMTQA